MLSLINMDGACDTESMADLSYSRHNGTGPYVAIVYAFNGRLGS